MGATEFASYLSHEISSHRAQFNKYLTEFVKEKIYTQRKDAFLRSEPWPDNPQEASALEAQKHKEWSTFTNADIKAGIQSLREECESDPTNSDLVQKLIIPFLRLPPMKIKHAQHGVDARYDSTEKFADGTGSKSTHPSAGLGYLRTKAYLANHPILGPQGHPTPVPARVVQPRSTVTVHESKARLGVAGFVANDEFRSGSSARYDSTRDIRDVESLDIDSPGGGKLFVNPQFASVDSEGRVILEIQRADSAAVSVKRGQLTDIPPTRENFDSSGLGDILKGVGKSGIKGLDNETPKELSNEEIPGGLLEALGKLNKEGTGKEA